jgi:GNAT superfamily N-acetyltransferase
VFGPDTQLIADQTYYVAEGETGELIASGGWSRRRTLYGGDQMKEATDPLLNPATDAARIRAFFVHPAWARRGLGRQLFDCCAADAARAGFRTFELVATLPGEPLYLALGFVPLERSVVALPDGEQFPVVLLLKRCIMVPATLLKPFGLTVAVLALLLAGARRAGATEEEFVGPFPSWKDLKRDYGAKGDGKADDTAVQKALDDADLQGIFACREWSRRVGWMAR